MCPPPGPLLLLLRAGGTGDAGLFCCPRLRACLCPRLCVCPPLALVQLLLLCPEVTLQLEEAPLLAHHGTLPHGPACSPANRGQGAVAVGLALRTDDVGAPVPEGDEVGPEHGREEHEGQEFSPRHCWKVDQCSCAMNYDVPTLLLGPPQSSSCTPKDFRTIHKTPRSEKFEKYSIGWKLKCLEGGKVFEGLSRGAFDSGVILWPHPS